MGSLLIIIVTRVRNNDVAVEKADDICTPQYNNNNPYQPLPPPNPPSYRPPSYNNYRGRGRGAGTFGEKKCFACGMVGHLIIKIVYMPVAWRLKR